MENGRIEPLRALPVHRDNFVDQIRTMYIDFPFDGIRLDQPPQKKDAKEGVWELPASRFQGPRRLQPLPPVWPSSLTAGLSCCCPALPCPAQSVAS